MSQSITSFFPQAKRATRSNRSAKVLDVPAEDPPPTKRSTRAKNSKKDIEIKTVENANKIEVNPVVDEEANVLKEVPQNVEPKTVEQKVTEEKSGNIEEKAKPKRGRKKIVKEIDEKKDDCPSPAKRNRRNTEKTNVEEAIEEAKKLTPAEVKQKLKGVKLTDLKEKLKKIEKSAESKEVKAAKSEAAAKKTAEDKAKRDAKSDYEKCPAYIRFHQVSLKPDGTLPLPYSYKFLEEVFRCTEQITAMLHNRHESITFEKLKVAVQQMLRKSFTVSYLKQIKTVFPEAYRFAWENIIGRYGKKMAEMELNMFVNMKYKENMITRLAGGEAPECPDEDKVANHEKLGPQAMVERKTLFHNSLLDLVKKQHQKFCTELKPPVKVEDEKLTRFHKDFLLDKCDPIQEAELPPKPEVEVATTAAQVLEKSRALFEVNPKLSESLAKVAEKKQETDASPAPPAPVQTVRKDLKGLPQKLIDKILAKEAEKAAREMCVDKPKEDRIRRLRRLPQIIRIIKGVFVTERKPALELPIVTKKTVQSYPGSMSEENLLKDVRFLVEVTAKSWLSTVTIQGKEYLKINQSVDVNTVVAEIEKLLAAETN